MFLLKGQNQRVRFPHGVHKSLWCSGRQDGQGTAAAKSQINKHLFPFFPVTDAKKSKYLFRLKCSQSAPGHLSLLKGGIVATNN